MKWAMDAILLYAGMQLICLSGQRIVLNVSADVLQGAIGSLLNFPDYRIGSTLSLTSIEPLSSPSTGFSLPAMAVFLPAVLSA